MSFNKRKRQRGGAKFVQLECLLMDEPAFKALSCGAQMLYVHIKRFYNGNNNGEIYLSIRKAAGLLNVAPNTASKYFLQLQEHGLIRLKQLGCLGIEGRGKANTWILTEKSFNNRPPERAYKKWKSKSPYQ